MGQPLFVRGRAPVQLTDAGELLREYAERLLNLRDEIQKGMDDLRRAGPRRTLARRERKLDPRAAAGARALSQTCIPA